MADDLDIIGLWEKGKKLNPDIEIDINKTIESRSKGTLFWIKVILNIEFWINVICLPLFIYFLIIQNKDYLWGFSAVIVTIIYLFYYQFLIKQITRFNYTEDVRTSLKKLYGYLRFFVLHYKVVIWISLLIGLIKGFIDDVPKSVTPEQMAEPFFWPLIIGVSAVFASIVGLIMTLLINLIYGRKIKRLKKLISEFSR
ncbi:MAG: hypothetical protein RIC35_21715 [Marinoscillum sp.]